MYIYCLIDGEWIYVTELHKSASAMSLGAECVFTAIEGDTYRADYTCTVTKNGVSEIIEVSDTKTYS